MSQLKILPYSTEKVKLRNKNLFTSTVDNNEGHKRYFSSIDAEIYFGDIFIDDINRIEYSVIEKTLPIYGYNSKKFDFLLYGTRYIQGEFIINFTKSGWLLDIMKGLSSVVGKEKDNINKCCNRTNSCGEIKSDLFDGVFDIIVSFGDHKSSIRSFGSSAHMIKGVRINGYNQMLDTSGEPIAERYSFIAQDIEFDIDTSGGLDNTFDKGNNNTSLSHVKSEQKPKMTITYNKDTKEVAKSKARANEEQILALTVEAEYKKGNLKTIIKLLNDNIDKQDIKINKVTITFNDRRPSLKNLPILKSTDFKYTENGIEVDMPLDNMPIYDNKIAKVFESKESNTAIDISVSVDLTYKNTQFTSSNQSIKITPSENYTF